MFWNVHQLPSVGFLAGEIKFPSKIYIRFPLVHRFTHVSLMYVAPVQLQWSVDEKMNYCHPIRLYCSKALLICQSILDVCFCASFLAEKFCVEYINENVEIVLQFITSFFLFVLPAVSVSCMLDLSREDKSWFCELSTCKLLNQLFWQKRLNTLLTLCTFFLH